MVGVEFFALCVSGARSKIGWVALAFAHLIKPGKIDSVIKKDRKKAKIALTVM
jgi:hypothetical protein